MWILLVTAIIVVAVLVWFWIIRTRKEPESDVPTYECPECGEKHCNCYLQE